MTRPCRLMTSLCLAGLMATALLSAACTSEDRRPEIVVGAASSLEPLIPQISERFEEEYGVDVTLVFGASGTLARQIEQGAPIDVFASADTGFMEVLDTQGLVERSTIEVFARGRLVIVATREPAENTETVARITDARRIAIANPETAPYGAAAKHALERRGVWDEVQDRIVYTQNAGQILQLVQSGQVDLGFVPVSLVFGRSVREVVFPRDFGSAALSEHPLEQTVAVVAASAQKGLARRFVETLTSPEADDLLARHGYEPIQVPASPRAK